MKLTDEQKALAAYCLDDFFLSIGEPVVRYDEFKKYFLESDYNEPETLITRCELYKNGDQFIILYFCILYDMWVNSSPIWPVPYNPEWEKQEN